MGDYGPSRVLKYNPRLRPGRPSREGEIAMNKTALFLEVRSEPTRYDSLYTFIRWAHESDFYLAEQKATAMMRVVEAAREFLNLYKKDYIGIRANGEGCTVIDNFRDAIAALDALEKEET